MTTKQPSWLTFNPNTYVTEKPVPDVNDKINLNKWPVWNRPVELSQQEVGPVTSTVPQSTQLNWNTFQPNNVVPGINGIQNPAWSTVSPLVPAWNNFHTEATNFLTAEATTSTTTTASTTQAPMNGNRDYFVDCRNFNDQICTHYASMQLCRDTHFINGFPITTQCAKACGKC